MTNNKIAKALGFTETESCWVEYPSGIEVTKLPDFMHSMDVCIQYIVPRIKDHWAVGNTRCGKHKFICVIGVPDLDPFISEFGKTIPEAFCKAAYKYLEEDNKQTIH